MIKALLTLAAQLVLVAVAVFAADAMHGRIDVIPKWVINLPGAVYTRDEFWTVFTYFMVVHLLVLGTAQLLRGRWRPTDPRRTADELFALAVAFAAAALLVFVTTTVAYDPQFIVGIALCTAAFTALAHLVARVAARDGLVASVLQLVKAVLRRTFSIPGIIILAFALSPAVLAGLFVKSRDVANVITEIRIRVASLKAHDWQVVNALGEQTFTQPILVQFPPHDPNTIYVLERGGRLLRMPWGEQRADPEVVLDINPAVGYVEVENGALGFAFHPRFGSPGTSEHDHIYLYYTSVIDGEQVNRLSRFSLGAPDPAARAASEEVLILWDRKNDGFHNGGSVEFGPDGFLYVAIGEMSEGDSHQRIDGALVSGILRIDVDQQGADVSRPIARQPETGTTQGYFIPLDNPFADDPDALGEFWAVGLRNPFRISFDPANGNLWAGDVGSTVWEEVNLIRRGYNYQYPFIEGREATNTPRPAQVTGIEKEPIYTYRHTAYDRAVIGGIVYRGTRYPALQGQYIFGDNYSGKIWAMPAADTVREQVEVIAQANQFAQRGLTSFAQSPDGQILITTLGKAGAPGGEVLTLVPASSAAAAAAPAKSAAPETVSSAEARGLFNTNCARCHGSGGAGDGPDAKHLNVPMPDMSATAFLQQRSDTRLLEVIRDGGAAHGLSPMMPPWGMVLSDAELQAMVDYIRGLDGAAK